MSKEKQIEEMDKDIGEAIMHNSVVDIINGGFIGVNSEGMARELYDDGYRKQNDEELIDKIATYFEKEDNWTKLKYSWNVCGKSVQLRDMLRDAITEAPKMKGGAE